jgi:SlyX protein
MNEEFRGRLEELESRLAFQDDLIESLNDVVARQDREIRDLRAKLKDLDERIRDLSDSASSPGSSPEHEIPPHY